MALLISFLIPKNISGIACFVLVPENVSGIARFVLVPGNISGIATFVLGFEKLVEILVSLLLMARTAGDGAPVVENSTETL